jgi:hypothetical protein
MHTFKKTSSMLWVKWTALLSSLMITVQIVILLLGKEGLCLSQGCQVVERLTRVSPLLFNIAGFLFFQAVFWGLYRVKNESENRSKLVRLLLLTGLAAEGVLVGFQQIVAGSFCTYCLIVLGFIVLLNLLAGIKQLLAGAFVFGVVLLAFSSLEFKHDQMNQRAMNEGIFASKINPSSAVSVHLFYSSTCSHCQRVLEIMVKNPTISMHFNPIDMISSIDAPGVILNLNYSPAANKALLNSLDIGEIPVLLERKNNGYSIIKGESAIVAYFDSLDKPIRNAASLPITPSNDSREKKSLIPGTGDQAEGCSVNTDCNTIPSLPAIIPAR